MTLYELNGEFAEVANRLADCEDEIEAGELLDRLEQLTSDINVKAENYARYIANLKGEVTMIDGEIKRLTAMKKSRTNTIDEMKSLLLGAMQNMGTRKIETSIGKWSIQRNSIPTVEVLDEKAIPKEFLIPQPDKVDTATIRDWFKKTGEIVDGVNVYVGEGLRFR